MTPAIELVRCLPAGGVARLVREDRPGAAPSWAVVVLARGRSLRVRYFDARPVALLWFDSL